MLPPIGIDVLPRSPAHFGNIIADETKKWAKVIGAANIKPIDAAYGRVGVSSDGHLCPPGSSFE